MVVTMPNSSTTSLANEVKTSDANYSSYTINPQKHVKIWISKDGLPPKVQARFLRFREQNPTASLTLIYADAYLTPTARKELHDFAKKARVTLVEYDSIVPQDAEEKEIKENIDHELAYFFKQVDPSLKGNLSVVADQLRLFEQVLHMGMVSDCDVEFKNSLPNHPLAAPLGFIAKTRQGVDGHSGGTRISNDLIGGDPKHPVFKTAKRLVCAYNRQYQTALLKYFGAHHIAHDASNPHTHPLYYKVRNERLSQFTLGGGPQLFARALHQHGFVTGYEQVTPPEVFTFNDDFVFTPYEFSGAEISEEQRQRNFKLMLPPQLSCSLVAHWDHSWQVTNTAWQRLTTDEAKHLDAHTTVAVPKRHVSYLRTYLSLFQKPYIAGRRHREFHELSAPEQSYIYENETPSRDVRTNLENTLGEEFRHIASMFSRDGVLIMPAYFQGAQLAALQHAFKQEIRKKAPHPFLKQTAFNAAVDDMDDKSFETIVAASTDETLQALIKYHFGQDPTLAAMRGYRQEKTPSMLYRAWDYHQDLKTKGPFGEIKIMILLTDTPIEGQAMRVMKGSHMYHWFADSQQRTKYNLDECLQYATDHCATICAGTAGTVILFDTNILHSGHRNDHSVRDIYTVTYTPDSKEAPVMSSKFAACRTETVAMTHTANPQRWRQIDIESKSLSPTATALLRAEYRRIPTIESSKMRFQIEGHESFHDFVGRIISIDLNSDLDLRLRMGKADTIRDNQLVALRDVPPGHTQFMRLKERITAHRAKATIAYKLDIDKLVTFAAFAGETLLTSRIKELSSCATFILDLQEALTRIDSRQRLRTTLAYLYFTLDRMQHLLETHREATSLSYTQLKQAADEVLDQYISYVYIDDLEQGLYNDKEELSSVDLVAEAKALPPIRSIQRATMFTHSNTEAEPPVSSPLGSTSLSSTITVCAT